MNWRPILCAAAVMLCAEWASATAALPTLQDLQIAGRVLHFREGHIPGNVDLAIVYTMTDAASRAEATSLAALLGDGLLVGDVFLRPHLVEQASLANARRFDAIFMATAVDGTIVMASTRKYRIPCLTRHMGQVENDVCTVAITSAPSVAIVVSSRNATTLGIRFATAFRMMVREI